MVAKRSPIESAASFTATIHRSGNLRVGMEMALLTIASIELIIVSILFSISTVVGFPGLEGLILQKGLLPTGDTDIFPLN